MVWRNCEGCAKRNSAASTRFATGQPNGRITTLNSACQRKHPEGVPGTDGDWKETSVPSLMQVTKELARREFLVDYRPGAGIRIALRS
jgi:hypothetical protein